MFAAVPAPFFFSKREQVLGCTNNTSLPFSLFLHPCKLHSLHGNAIKRFMMGMCCGAEAPQPLPACSPDGSVSPPVWFPHRFGFPAALVSLPRARLRETGEIFIYKLSVQMFSLWFAVHWCHLVGGELN